MVNPKKNPLMDLEVTEGSEKKARTYRTAVTASPLWRPEGATWEKPSLVMDGEEMWPRSWWCCRQDPSREPCPAAGLAQQGKHPCLSFLPCCFTCYLTPPQKIHLAKAFKLCKRVWKKKSSQKCSYFQEKEQNRSCQGRKFVFYCHDRGRGPDQLEGLPMLWKISTDYQVSGKKIQKAANEVNLIRIFSKIAACSCHLVCLLYKCWYVQRTVRCPGPDCRKRTTRIGNGKCCGQQGEHTQTADSARNCRFYRLVDRLRKPYRSLSTPARRHEGRNRWLHGTMDCRTLLSASALTPSPLLDPFALPLICFTSSG